MLRMYVVLLPALLFAADNSSPVTVRPHDGAVPTGAALVASRPAPGGIYFCRLVAGHYRATRKLLVTE